MVEDGARAERDVTAVGFFGSGDTRENRTLA